jgi:hypothetical protein
MPFLLPQIPQRDQRTLFWPNGQPQIYEIPDNAVMLYIYAVGGGGPGGNGFTRAAAAAGGGGGGGGSGAVMRIWIPVETIKRVLYVNPGFGGAPGTAGGASWVSRFNTTSAFNSIAVANGGGAGGNGTGAAAGGAGTAGTVTAATGIIPGHTGLPVFGVGHAGAAGGAQTGAAGGTSVWATTTPAFSSGAGGGGTTSADFAGGNVTGNADVPTRLGGAAGSNNGADGLWWPDLMFSTGGAGGGSSNTGIGGNGGHAGPGSGGGGGGAGTTGGTGGKGGNGFVLIVPIIS